MVKDPRPHKPGSPEPDDALDLLRALARRRAGEAPPHEGAPAAPAENEDDKLTALRALAETLDRQLRESSAPADAHNRAAPPDDLAPPPPGPPGFSLAREWKEFVAGLPRARDLVPRFHLRNAVFAAIAMMALALALVAALTGRRPATRPTDVTVPTQIVPPIAQTPPAQTPAESAPPIDLPAITKAMSECDAAAVRESDALYFLVLPLMPAKQDGTDWRKVALQKIGNAYLLLSAKDALDGVRDGRLAVRPGRFTFSALDANSGATYSWTSATSLSRLSKKDSGTVKVLKLGFDFSAAQTGAQWSAEFKRDPGICYWVSVLVTQ